MTHQPIENCYWVVPGRLLAGEYPGDRDEALSRQKLNALILAGVTTFIDLTEEDEDLEPYAAFLGSACHERYPVRDVSTPGSRNQTLAILDAIDRCIAHGGIVYVHCMGGIGRTGVIVGCWLARHGFKGEAALARLHELWRRCPKSAYRNSPETREQERYILEWTEAVEPKVGISGASCIAGMERKRLPDTDLLVSPICYGTARFGSEVVGDELDGLMAIFRDAGGNFIDTAHCYAFWLPQGAGCSEQAIGDYMCRNGKGDLVIATKGGHPGAEGYRRVEHWLSPERIEADIDDSLGRLGLDTIDLFWLHRDETCLPVSVIVDALNREVRRGRVRWLGASNWRPARIAEANAYAAAHGLQGFVASQPEWSLARKNTPNIDPKADTTNGNVMLFLEEQDQEWHRRTRLPVVPYTATAGGYFASGGTSAVKAFDNPVSRTRLARAHTLAGQVGATVGQVALAWLMLQDFPVFPIIGARNPDHLLEDLESVRCCLSADQVRLLAGQ